MPSATISSTSFFLLREKRHKDGLRRIACELDSCSLIVRCVPHPLKIANSDMDGKKKFTRRGESKRIFKRNGDSTLPCGQPRSSFLVKEEFSTVESVTLLSCKRQKRALRTSPRKIAGFHVASNALLMSRNAHATIFLCLELDSIREINFTHADSVDRLGRKPCCTGLTQLLDSARSRSLASAPPFQVWTSYDTDDVSDVIVDRL